MFIARAWGRRIRRDSKVRSPERRLRLLRKLSPLALLVLLAPALDANAAAGSDGAIHLSGNPIAFEIPVGATCYAPSSTLFTDDFESADVCRWTLTNPADGSCPAPICGDGLVTGDEVCDDGNVVDEDFCDYGLLACSCCNSTCTGYLELTGGYCGDGNVDSSFGEACDDGNNVSETSCAYGVPTCSACNADCSLTLHLVGSYCGDGTVDAGEGEVCDDGNAVTETSCPYGSAACTRCNADCSAALVLTGNICGDGVVDVANEACDDHNTSPCGTCSSDCQTHQFIVSGCGTGVGCSFNADCLSGVCSDGVCGP
ncbi:MAG TPA: DUF4215 domain-containing protein [Gaiellaceae bacterium]|nr:DUF4215 domain-containing protein [Gaiellaceae bacterium]